MERIKVYLASGWFNPEQMKQMQEIYEVLSNLESENEIELFSPYYDGIVLKKDDPNLKKKMEITWWLDIEKIKQSDLIVACTQDHDVGTIYECGYARGFMDGYNTAIVTASLCKTVICYNSKPELGLNLMLAQEARAFCKTKEQLHDAVCHLIATPKEERRYFRHNAWEGDPI